MQNFLDPSPTNFGTWTIVTANGVPLLSGVAAHFEYRCRTRHPGGDHEIYMGEVVAYDDHRREPLVFHRGALHKLQNH